MEKVKAWLDSLGGWKYVIAAVVIFGVTVAALAAVAHSIMELVGHRVNLSMLTLLKAAVVADLIIAVAIYVGNENLFIHGKTASTTHGSADFMGPVDLNKAYTVAKPKVGPGMPVGYKPGSNKVIYIDPDPFGNSNILIVGETGKGKTRSIIMPAILEFCRHGDSTVITDPKGELYASFAATLSTNGYTVYPIILKRDGMQHSIRFNPLHHIRDGVDIREQVDLLFAAAGITAGGEFWVRLAKQLLMTLIEYVRTVFTEPTYGDVYDFLVQYGAEDMRSMFSGLSENHPARSYWGPISGSDDKILTSAITELGTILSIFAQPEVKTLTACSDISPDVPAKEKAAVFILCDSENSTYDILTTMYLSTCIREVIRHQDDVIAEVGELRRVRFILDEIANIAGIRDIERKLNTCRSRKVSAIAACQTTSQIKTIVDDPIKESDLIGAFGYFIILGSSDLETMRYFSEMAGESTVVDTAHESSGAVRYTYTSRKLITPDEIRRIPQDQLILFRSGFQPIRLKKLKYQDFVTGELSRNDYRCRAKHPLITGGWDTNGKNPPEGFDKHKPHF